MFRIAFRACLGLGEEFGGCSWPTIATEASSGLGTASDASSASEIAKICVKISLCQSDAVLVRLRRTLGEGDIAFILFTVSSVSISASVGCLGAAAVALLSLLLSVEGIVCCCGTCIRCGSFVLFLFNAILCRCGSIVACDSFLPTACCVTASSALFPSIGAPGSRGPNPAIREGSYEISICLSW